MNAYRTPPELFCGTVHTRRMSLVLSFEGADYATLCALEQDAHNRGFTFTFWVQK